MNTCNEYDCNTKAIARGYCDLHYRRVKKYGSTSLPIKEVRICEVESCNSVVASLGFCSMHYARYYNNGDPLIVKHRINREGVSYKNMPEYAVWCNMKARCYRPNHMYYKNYGGRGITICDEWLNNFPQFLEDMGRRPLPKYKIDRIDNNGNYTPENCRWTTDKINSNNKRTNKYITHRGQKLSYTQWSDLLGGDKHLVSDRIRILKWDEIRAVTTPPRKHKKFL